MKGFVVAEAGESDLEEVSPKLKTGVGGDFRLNVVGVVDVAVTAGDGAAGVDGVRKGKGAVEEDWPDVETRPRILDEGAEVV